jgi:hypothetical protein
LNHEGMFSMFIQFHYLFSKLLFLIAGKVWQHISLPSEAIFIHGSQ